jgi:hypothetical protein
MSSVASSSKNVVGTANCEFDHSDDSGTYSFTLSRELRFSGTQTIASQRMDHSQYFED